MQVRVLLSRYMTEVEKGLKAFQDYLLFKNLPEHEKSRDSYIWELSKKAELVKEYAFVFAEELLK